MPLYIRDDGVDALAVEVKSAIGASSKTEAVRIALQHELERHHERVPLSEQIAELQRKARQLGLPNPHFDMKRFTDEMWGDL